MAENEIHVWKAPLDLELHAARRLEATLAPDERARAARFVFERDRNRFAAARGILRELLAKYLDRSPSEFHFKYGPQGKPFLSMNNILSPMQFNVSHSHGMALFAFSQARRLGVDVEKILPEFADEEIARRYFSASEVAELESLPAKSRTEAFFLCWTRKEAYVKARSQGLSISLASFSVSLTPGHYAKLHSQDSDRWTLVSLRPGRHYVGAMVAEGRDLILRQLEWGP